MGVDFDPRAGYWEKGFGICGWCGCPEYRIEPKDEKHSGNNEPSQGADEQAGEQRPGSDVQGQGGGEESTPTARPRVRRANDQSKDTEK